MSETDSPRWILLSVDNRSYLSDMTAAVSSQTPMSYSRARSDCKLESASYCYTSVIIDLCEGFYSTKALRLMKTGVWREYKLNILLVS